MWMRPRGKEQETVRIPTHQPWQLCPALGF